MGNFRFWVLILNIAAASFTFSGCATYEYGPQASSGSLPGVYHRVEIGQTLFSISRMYRVDLDELVRANRILDASRIETGQLLLIPNRQRPLSTLAKYSGDDFIWPVKGRVIAYFGASVNNAVNKGLNIQAARDSSILAARRGKVVFCANDFLNFGKTIILDHGDGFLTVYARNSENLVRLGDTIEKGAVIARVGSAGREQSAYLHFQIRKSHIAQNPYFYLSP